MRRHLSIAVSATALAAATLLQEPERWQLDELERTSAKIQDQVAAIRGASFQSAVPVKLGGKQDLIDYIELRLAKTDPPAKRGADHTIAKLLGAVAPDADLDQLALSLLETQVAGFYDPDSDSFSLMDTMPRDLTSVILAHELCHALDDQLFDIDGTLERIGADSDAVLAYHAVVEGSGTAVMTDWMKRHGGEIDLVKIAEEEMKKLTSFGGAPSWLWKPLLGSYQQGSAFLQRSESWIAAQMGSAVNEDIDAAFKDPPRSTEQVLHPDKYWNAQERDEPRRSRFDASKLGEGWEVLREDTLGELLIGIICTPPARRESLDFTNPMALLGLTFTDPVAEGWGGDRVILLARGDARLLRWVTVWDSERDAGEFFGAMQQLVPAMEGAAQALARDSKDAAATVEYGERRDEVIVTVRSGVGRIDGRRVLRSLTHAEVPAETR